MKAYYAHSNLPKDAGDHPNVEHATEYGRIRTPCFRRAEVLRSVPSHLFSYLGSNLYLQADLMSGNHQSPTSTVSRLQYFCRKFASIKTDAVVKTIEKSQEVRNLLLAPHPVPLLRAGPYDLGSDELFKFANVTHLSKLLALRHVRALNGPALCFRTSFCPFVSFLTRVWARVSALSE